MSAVKEFPSVDDILQAMRLALSSDTGRNEFHRLAARQEAAVHAGLQPGAEDDDAA